jgi:hypothetical protein
MMTTKKIKLQLPLALSVGKRSRPIPEDVISTAIPSFIGSVGKRGTDCKIWCPLSKVPWNRYHPAYWAALEHLPMADLAHITGKAFLDTLMRASRMIKIAGLP